MKAARDKAIAVLTTVSTIGLATIAGACIASDDPSSVAEPAPAQQQTAAEELLARTIAYHDPDGHWFTAALRFDIDMGHSEWWDRDVDLLIDNSRGIFEAHMTWGEDTVEVERHGNDWTTRLNGSEQISAAELDHHDLEPDGLSYWSNYFLFVFGLPMKYRDPGLILDPEPIPMEFEGRDVLALRATFEPDVGSDTWYLFVDPESARLVGCRFFHDESLPDGDTMVFEGEVAAGSIRLPASRTWSSNSDGNLRGTDTIRSISIERS